MKWILWPLAVYYVLAGIWILSVAFAASRRPRLVPGREASFDEAIGEDPHATPALPRHREFPTPVNLGGVREAMLYAALRPCPNRSRAYAPSEYPSSSVCARSESPGVRTNT